MAGPGDSWLGLEGKVVAITGAGGGIGRATAAEFANVGAKVVLLDVNLEACGKAAHEISAASNGSETSAVKCDVSDDSGVTTAAFARRSRRNRSSSSSSAAGTPPPPRRTR